MSRDSISKRLINLLEKKLGSHGITEAMSFENDLRMDSLDRVEMTIFLEEEFGIEISDAAAEQMLVVKDAVDWLDKNGAED